VRAGAALPGIVLLCSGCGGSTFVATLPQGLPDLRTWEKSTGWAELDSPRRTVEYELYVGPQRQGVYSVTRYRITIKDPHEQRKSGITPIEKLQWDLDGRDVRRFECAPPSGRGAHCTWKQIPTGSPEYLREMPVLLSVYGLHRRLLYERDERRRAKEAR
jgi:hypothetical protein